MRASTQLVYVTILYTNGIYIQTIYSVEGKEEEAGETGI